MAQPGYSSNILYSATHSQDKCAACGKAVYAAEKIGVQSEVFHDRCFRCANTECGKKLVLGNFMTVAGKCYCRSHGILAQAFSKLEKTDSSPAIPISLQSKPKLLSILPVAVSPIIPPKSGQIPSQQPPLKTPRNKIPDVDVNTVIPSIVIFAILEKCRQGILFMKPWLKQGDENQNQRIKQLEDQLEKYQSDTPSCFSEPFYEFLSIFGKCAAFYYVKNRPVINTPEWISMNTEIAKMIGVLSKLLENQQSPLSVPLEKLYNKIKVLIPNLQTDDKALPLTTPRTSHQKKKKTFIQQFDLDGDDVLEDKDEEKSAEIEGKKDSDNEEEEEGKQDTSNESSETENEEEEDAEEIEEDAEENLGSKKDLCEMTHTFYSLLTQKSDTQSKEIAELVEEFTTSAGFLAKLIISENSRPNSEKLFKNEANKGIAGGEKFMRDSFFFKFPRDKLLHSGKWLYGEEVCNDEMAAKASNHDLKGWTNLFLCDKEHFFHFPLIATIDYCGYRITVTTTVPVTKQSLVYGSGDGGVTVHFDDSKVNELMSKFGKELNLLPHKTVNNKEALIALCADIEVHKGKDNKFYLLDWARTTPPQFPTTNDQTNYSPFCTLLRAEMVLQSPKPLNCDALTGFVDDSREYDTDIKNATKQLNTITRKFAKFLSNTDVNATLITPTKKGALNTNSDNITLVSHDILIVYLHKWGINIRFLGDVRKYLARDCPKQNPLMEQFLLEIMVLRVLKNFWRSEIKQKSADAAVDLICKSVTLDIINKFLAKDQDLMQNLFTKLTEKFGNFNLALEKFHEILNIPFIILQFCRMCGINLSSEAKEKLCHLMTHPVHPIEFRLNLVDILEFSPKIHYPDVLNMHVGKYILQQIDKNTTLPEKRGLLFAAASKLEQIAANTNCSKELTYLYAHAKFSLYKISPGEFPCDLPAIVKAIGDYWEEEKDVLPESDLLQIQFEYVSAFFLLNKSDQTPASNSLRELTKGIWLQELFKNSSEKLFKLLEEMKYWDVDIDHVHIFDTILELLPDQYSIKLLQGELTRKGLQFKKKCFNSSRFDISEEQKSENINFLKKCIENFYETVIKQTPFTSQNENTKNKQLTATALEKLHSDFLAEKALIYLYMPHTTQMKNFLEYIEAKGGSWWYHIQSFICSSTPEKFFIFWEQITKQYKNQNNPLFCLLCEIFFWETLTNSKLSSYSSSTFLQLLRNLHTEYIEILITIHQEDPTYFLNSWFSGFKELHQFFILKNQELVKGITGPAFHKIFRFQKDVLESLSNTIWLQSENYLTKTALQKQLNPGTYNFQHPKLSSDIWTDRLVIDEDGCAPIHYACREGHLEILTLLLRNNNNNIDLHAKNGNSPLHIAAQNGQEATVKLLLENRANPKSTNLSGDTPLHKAAANGHYNIVVQLLKSGATITPNLVGETPLHKAVEHANVVSLLIEHKASLDTCDKNKWTPLHVAALRGSVETVAILLDKGASDKVTDSDNKTALNIAALNGRTNIVAKMFDKRPKTSQVAVDYAFLISCEKGFFETAQYLFEKGGKINVSDGQHSPLVWASRNGHTKVVEFLIEKGATLTIECLHSPIRYGHSDVVSLLLEKGKPKIDLNCFSELNFLHTAVELNHKNVVESLLKHGANVETLYNESTPLLIAAQNGNLDIISVLISYKANIEAQDKEGWTALQVAAQYGYRNIVAFLLEKGAKIDVLNLEGKSALYVATQNGYEDIVTLLIDKGGNKNVTFNSETLLHCAVKEGHKKIVEILAEKGLDVHATTEHGNTILHYAAKFGQYDIAEILIGKNISLDAVNKGGFTAMNLATKKGYTNIVTLLESKGADPNKGVKVDLGHLSALFSLEDSCPNPPEAVECKQGDETYYLIVAHTEWGNIPGKGKSDVAWFSYGGTEYQTTSFSWLKIPGSYSFVKKTVSIPRNILECGILKDSQKPLYAAIAHTEWGDIPAKMEDNEVYFPHGGVEHKATDFSYVVVSKKVFISGDWHGSWIHSSTEGPMDFKLKFKDGQIKGIGKDGIGEFTWSGTYDNSNKNITMKKQYHLKHSIFYEGKKSMGDKIEGTWGYGQGPAGNFWLRQGKRK